MQDLGDAGPRESAPVVYHWSIVWTLARLAPLLLLGLLLLRKPNRGAKAWLILPLTVIYLAILTAAGAWASEAWGDLEWLLGGLAVFVIGLGIVWSLVDFLAPGGRAGGFWGGAFVFCGAAFFSAICFSGFDAQYGVAFFMVAALCGLAYGIAMTAGGFACRKGFAERRFSRWYGVTLAATPFLVGLPFVLMGALFTIGAYGIGEALAIVLPFAGVCLFVSIVLLAFTLPYLWIGFKSAHYRKALSAIFRLPGLEAAGAAPTIEGA